MPGRRPLIKHCAKRLTENTTSAHYKGVQTAARRVRQRTGSADGCATALQWKNLT